MGGGGEVEWAFSMSQPQGEANPYFFQISSESVDGDSYLVSLFGMIISPHFSLECQAVGILSDLFMLWI